MLMFLILLFIEMNIKYSYNEFMFLVKLVLFFYDYKLIG